MKFGEVIKGIRLNEELNQRDFADSIGITVSYVSMLERDIRTPSIRLLEEIEYIYNMRFNITYELNNERKRVG